MKAFRIYEVVGGGLAKWKTKRMAPFDYGTLEEAEEGARKILEDYFIDQLVIQDYSCARPKIVRVINR